MCDVTVRSRIIFTGADGQRGGKMSGRTCCEVDQRHVSQVKDLFFVCGQAAGHVSAAS